MVDKNKILYLDNVFTKALPTSEESIDSIYIEGYASTADVDRHGDVIPPSVWEAGLENYLKNPVILAYHDHDDPCGRMVEHKVDVNGLWIKARISAAAEVFNLVKDGIVTAFSVGFRIKDAEYNSAAEVFMVTELELHEISVVAVPANQNTLFNLSKSFETDEEYKSFKSQFAPKGESAKGLESITEAESTNIIKEFGMNQEEIKQMLADAAKQAADQATKAIAEKQAQAEAEKAAAAKAEAELDARIKAAVASVSVGESGAEKLLAEVEKRFADQAESTKSVIAGLESALKEKAAEIEAIQKSKMQFNGDKGDMSYADKEKAVLLGKMAGKSLDGTKFGREMVQKYGAHLPSATWELEVSLNMENEVRRRLVVAPTLRNVSMQTNVMTLPVNPEAGVATWMANTAFGTTASAGATQNHALKEITLNAYKVATNEYLAYEEEEDSLLVLMPIVRDAMVRRVARAVDRAFLLGAGAGADPVKGLATYDAVADVSPSAASGVVTIANLRAMRKGLGAWGLDPAEMVYVVSTEVYYDLLEDVSFQTMDKVGTKATILTGQVGSIGNTPVLVSAEFASKASGEVGAIAYAPGNFLVGNQRGLRVDTQELVETQRRVMVASLRTGMTQVTTNLGAGVSKLVYSA
jgi:HK97 family phage prohead protease/HK97 family phage major capsid protein